MFVVILLTFCIDFVQINMYVCMYCDFQKNVRQCASDSDNDEGMLRVKNRFKYDLRKYCFCNRVVNTWNNSLPNYVVSANTTNVFKNRLDKFWHDQEIIRPPVRSNGRTYKMLVMFFLFFNA